ncbi:hypothetical protein [Sphingomonas sp.]|jgi:hypothetical protein|uniref:hypothetical protein n=1 Tax=Sphingomonas sp. TaxID=28214 RepID=UPI002D7F49E6|nr:hypothetical protein [Sphingomonas sp.]HEU0045868.1 hypothetical protein [Sphingomonas sp.]
MLTNGVVYKFFSDIEKPNIMDSKPFFIFSLDAIKRSDPATLERFTRSQFDIGAIIAEAGRLKLESQVRIEVEREFSQPSEEWVRAIAKRISTAPLSAGMRETYGQLIAAAIAQLIRERVNERLTSALHVANPEPVTTEEGKADDPSDGDGVITSEDEIAGFRIVQAIAARHIDPAGSSFATASPIARSCSMTTTASRSRGCTSTVPLRAMSAPSAARWRRVTW